MSSDPQTTLELLWTIDYACLVVVTALVYDYILMFSAEIEYVWCKPWTWVSTLYIIVRYIGLYWSIVFSFVDTTFLFGPLKHNIRLLPIIDGRLRYDSKGTILFIIACWLLPVFFGAADLVMILRVYSIWNPSNPILFVLMFFFSLQLIIGFISCWIYDNPTTHLSVKIEQVFNVASCRYTYHTTFTLLWCSLSVQFVLGVSLLTLALIKALKDSLEMYRATREWRPNRYMKLLAKDGVLYFIANLLRVSSVINAILNDAGYDNFNTLLEDFSYLVVFPVLPRFIIAVRELYDCPDRWQGIDVGFGVRLQPNASRNTAELAVALVDVETEPGPEDDRDARLSTKAMGLGEEGSSRV